MTFHHHSIMITEEYMKLLYLLRKIINYFYLKVRWLKDFKGNSQSCIKTINCYSKGKGIFIKCIHVNASPFDGRLSYLWFIGNQVEEYLHFVQDARKSRLKDFSSSIIPCLGMARTNAIRPIPVNSLTHNSAPQSNMGTCGSSDFHVGLLQGEVCNHES